MYMNIDTTPTCLYLYGIEPKFMSTLADMPYKQALLFKISLAKQVLTELLSVGFMEQDTPRINKVSKTIKFNEQLLDELSYHE